MIGQLFRDSMDRYRLLRPVSNVDNNTVKCKVYWQHSNKEGTVIGTNFGGFANLPTKLFEDNFKSAQYGFIKMEDAKPVMQ